MYTTQNWICKATGQQVAAVFSPCVKVQDELVDMFSILDPSRDFGDHHFYMPASLFEEYYVPCEPMPQSFEKELAQLINRHSMERHSNTQDFVLAEYISGCLNAFGLAVQKRDGLSKSSPCPSEFERALDAYMGDPKAELGGIVDRLRPKGDEDV